MGHYVIDHSRVNNFIIIHILIVFAKGKLVKWILYRNCIHTCTLQVWKNKTMPSQCRSYIVSILILEWSREIEPLNYVCLLTKLYLSRLYVRRSCVVFGQLGISDVEAKGTLLRRGIMFNHNKVDLYAVNPNDTDISQCSERVLIKGLSFWKSYALIFEYEKTVSQITICPSVYQSRSRNNITNSTSTCLNGDRLSTMIYTPSTLIGADRRLFMSHPALIANP